MKPKRRQEIFDLIEQYPGASGAFIFTKMIERSWIGRLLGPDSLIALLIGPSLGAVWVHLSRLEEDGMIRGEWIDGPYPRRRVYYPAHQ